MKLCLLGATLLAAFSSGCGPSESRLVPPIAVAGALTHAAREGAGHTVRLAELTDFPWDTFVAFGPYTDRARAESVLGFAWPTYDSWELATSESFSLLVFTKGQVIVRVERLARSPVEFAPVALARRFTPSQAVFTLLASDGRLLLVPTNGRGA
jgi:hypothetical protein